MPANQSKIMFSYTELQLISARREEVKKSYDAAKARNHRLFLDGDDKATHEYTYPNQLDDAHNIVNMFYEEGLRVISIQKKTKVGADGLMIEIARLLTTHPDDAIVVNPDNVRIITGMSNAGWEKDIKDKAPSCFQDKIFHHGKLDKTELQKIHNGLVIIDEIDTGDKERQKLHNTLKSAGILDVKHMAEHNNRFVLISATMVKELHDLYRWGPLHKLFTMTIPESYIGHSDFLERGILQEFYPLTTDEYAEKWVLEDIIENYGEDYRVHIVRVKTITCVQDACIRNGVECIIHTSNNRLSEDDITKLFKTPLQNHYVLCVKGLLRRANLIPNPWKLRIGATHEFYTKKVDNNVQIQGLPGRMTGYWRDALEHGHKTGPYRTSIQAIKEYEITYHDPFGPNPYQTSGFKKNNNGRVTISNTILSPVNIPNLEPCELPCHRRKGQTKIIICDIGIDIDIGDHDTLLDLLLQKNEQAYIKYKNYDIHVWKADTSDKCEKWGIRSMEKKNAYSTEANIRDKTKNTLMIYHHERRIIFCAWNGEETIM